MVIYWRKYKVVHIDIVRSYDNYEQFIDDNLKVDHLYIKER
jgi:hypothetical protein